MGAGPGVTPGGEIWGASGRPGGRQGMMGPRDEGGGMDERIVVGVDGTESSRRALGWAARLAKLTGSSLDVVIAWEVPANYRFDVSSPHDIQLGAETILQKVVADVLGARREARHPQER